MEYNISDKLKVMKPSAIREIFKSLTDPRIIAFAAGNPAAESFPAKEFASLAQDILEKDATKALQYGITEGYPQLRRQLEDRLAERFGCAKEGNTLLVVSGGQQGIELACKVMCNEGDVVLCEDPSFIGALNAFRSNGTELIGIGLIDIAQPKALCILLFEGIVYQPLVKLQDFALPIPRFNGLCRGT